MDEFVGKPRLPKFAVPKRYDIRIKPDLVACKFAGTVSVSVDVIEPTSFLVLNAADLSVQDTSVSFTSSSSEVFQPSKLELVEEDEILVLQFPAELPVGLGVLAIGFEGTLNDKMKGFYRRFRQSLLSYDRDDDLANCFSPVSTSIMVKKKNMAVTQFEPADARRCFPCWDEPACKATFKITLDVPSDLVALSNMPIADEEVHGDVKTLHYQESPIMSTYLVAVVIGLFDYVEDHTSDGVKVRVYSQVGKQDQGKFALHVAVKTLELYKEYFDTPYSLPKLDMIAIPDFAAGAMENYGLVTYRETALLYDEQHSAAVNKQMVATVVAHELAHQWFGNLVTMEWWTHLWLNEGFATWVSYLATDGLFPEWKIWTQFLEESTEGLRLDGLAESHPIEVDVNHAREIDEIFDAISYRKGASVIQMLQSYLGADVFQRSLAAYIKKHAFSNAKTEDLWAALEEKSHQPVNKLMTSWTKQMGYPVVSVKTKDGKLEFEQSQFLSSGSHGDGQWIVPITLCSGSYDENQNFLLETKSASVDVPDNYDWIKVNVNQAGFYRMKYSEDLEAKLRHAIEKKVLSIMDRYGILDDTYALCMARQQSLTSLLTLMAAYREDVEYTVLSNLIAISYKVARVAADATPDLVNDIKRFFINLFQYSAEKLGWDAKPGESHLVEMLRGEIFTALAVFGHDLTLQEACKRFDAFLSDRNTPLLPPDIRRAAYVAVMQGVSISNRSGFDSLLKVYRESDLSQEKTRILGSLGSTPDPGVTLEVLNFVLSPEVRSQDAVFGLAVSYEGRETAWEWFKSNWKYISKTWGSGFLITQFVRGVTTPFASFERAKEVEEFFATHSSPSIARTLKQSIERVHINAQWVQSIQNESHLAEAVQELAYRNY